jgi:hypothetical protein
MCGFLSVFRLDDKVSLPNGFHAENLVHSDSRSSLDRINITRPNRETLIIFSLPIFSFYANINDRLNSVVHTVIFSNRPYQSPNFRVIFLHIMPPSVNSIQITRSSRTLKQFFVFAWRESLSEAASVKVDAWN